MAVSVRRVGLGIGGTDQVAGIVVLVVELVACAAVGVDDAIALGHDLAEGVVFHVGRAFGGAAPLRDRTQTLVVGIVGIGGGDRTTFERVRCRQQVAGSIIGVAVGVVVGV